VKRVYAKEKGGQMNEEHASGESLKFNNKIKTKTLFWNIINE